MNTDFSMRIRSNGWTSDVVKYKDLAKDAEQLVNMLDDLDFNIESVSFEFVVDTNYEKLTRFFKLLRKGAAHVHYHGGITLVPVPPVSRGTNESYILGHLCTAAPAKSLGGTELVSTTITFTNIVKVKNQNVRGSTIVVNLGRLANALDWSIRHVVQLSDKPISLRTWNTITIWGENPWHKDEAKTPKTETADVYVEDNE